MFTIKWREFIPSLIAFSVGLVCVYLIYFAYPAEYFNSIGEAPFERIMGYLWPFIIVFFGLAFMLNAVSRKKKQ